MLSCPYGDVPLVFRVFLQAGSAADACRLAALHLAAVPDAPAIGRHPLAFLEHFREVEIVVVADLLRDLVNGAPPVPKELFGKFHPPVGNIFGESHAKLFFKKAA